MYCSTLGFTLNLNHCFRFWLSFAFNRTYVLFNCSSPFADSHSSVPQWELCHLNYPPPYRKLFSKGYLLIGSLLLTHIKIWINSKWFQLPIIYFWWRLGILDLAYCPLLCTCTTCHLRYIIVTILYRLKYCNNNCMNVHNQK